MTEAFSALTPSVDAVQASEHLRILHEGAEGIISLVLLGTVSGRETHSFFEWGEARPAADAQASRSILQECVDQHWNVYVGCSTFTSVPPKGRGTRAMIKEVPGVWADLDVKPGVEGYFSSEAELLEYTKRLPTPTIEIASGSGGRHLYWLTHKRLNASDGQNLLHAWLDFLREWSDGKTIENVQDSTRILRLAGTVRWPKQVDVEMMPRRVEMLNTGPRYHAAELQLMSSRAHEEAQEKRIQLRRFIEGKNLERDIEIMKRGEGKLEVYRNLIATFNRQQNWDDLLIPTGWQLLSDDREGAARCRFWVRPGKSTADGKSASTDFIYDDGRVAETMCIYSNEPSLVTDLWENAGSGDFQGRCSKWHYTIMRLYGGDEDRLIRDAVEGGGKIS